MGMGFSWKPTIAVSGKPPTAREDLFNSRLLHDNVVIGNGDAQGFAVGSVVLLGDLGGVLHRHGGDIRLAGEHLGSHLTGGIAQIVVADGQGGHTAAAADALFTGDDRHLGRQHHVGNGLGVGSSGVIGGDVDHIGIVTGLLGPGSNVVGVGEGILGAGETGILQVTLDHIHLVLGVALSGAVQQANLLGIGEQLLQHGSLL